MARLFGNMAGPTPAGRGLPTWWQLHPKEMPSASQWTVGKTTLIAGLGSTDCIIEGSSPRPPWIRRSAARTRPASVKALVYVHRVHQVDLDRSIKDDGPNQTSAAQIVEGHHGDPARQRLAPHRG